MTEADWLACTDPSEMLDFLSGKVTGRKLRLFGCACLRLIWSWEFLETPQAVELAEGFADGTVSKGALRRARQSVRDERLALEGHEAAMRPYAAFVRLTELLATQNHFERVFSEWYDDRLPFADWQWSTFCDRLRDVAGNPFRPLPPDPAWRTPQVASLAETIYQEKRFELLPILGDALLDAGCASEHVVTHCQKPGEHVRGCWALDLILERA